MRRSLTTVVMCLAAVAVVGNLGVLAVYVNRQMQKERLAESGGDRVQPQSFLEQTGGGKSVKLSAKLAESYGLETEPARTCTWQERVVVYGRVVPNPRASYEVRAPFAGVLRAADKGTWPTVGETVKPGQHLGRIVIRVGPQERLDLANRLAEAHLKRKGAEEVCALRQSLVESLEKARQTSVVAQRVLDDAKVQLTEAKTQLATAQATESLLKKATDDIKQMREDNALWSWLLTAPIDKGLSAELEVTELAGQPGMAIEAGGLIARVVDFSRPLVRLDLPAPLLQGGPPPEEIELSAGPLARDAGEQPQTMRAARVGPAPLIDAASQFVGWFYTIASGKETDRVRTSYRPGFFLQARLSRSAGETREAVAVPGTAILYHQGRALVYVRTGPDKYEKREVQVLGHEGERCILVAHSPLLPSGISADEVVVARQAQVLLSTEFREDADND